MRYAVPLALLFLAALVGACSDGGGSVTRTLGVDVSFGIDATDADLDAVAEHLRALDGGADLRREGSANPPIFHVKMTTSESCASIRSNLESRAYVREAVCRDADRTYGVSVTFNPESTELSDIDDVEEFLLGLSEDAGLLSLDSLPPIFNATWSTDDDAPCAKVIAELESRAYIREVDCQRVAYVPYGILVD